MVARGGRGVVDDKKSAGKSTVILHFPARMSTQLDSQPSPISTFRKRRLGVFAALLLAATPAFALVGSNSGTSIFNGLYINAAIGADLYYYEGYFGADAIVANIEAGYVWNGHETLTQVSTFLSDPTITGTSLGQFDWHATMVGQAINGNGLYTFQDGIAPQATLWSSAIATQWNGGPTDEYVGSFDITDASFLYGYTKPLLTGVNGHTANVINSSWGFGDPTGANFETVTIDAILRMSGAVGVFAAGNEGPTINTVGSPAAGFNGISVGALTGDTGPNPFSTVATFSSRGPNDFYNPVTHITLSHVRAAVDIAAPGDNLTLAFYGGLTGGHIHGADPTVGEFQGQYYIPDMGGTSFAAPIVAGAAALMVDAGKSFGGGEINDPRVIKAIMMTAATKTPGWDNGQHLDAGVIRTTQALDYVVGAGALNLVDAYRIQIGDPLPAGIRILGLNTTAGLLGLGGGSVLKRGWDYGQVSAGSPVDYVISESILAGDTFTATLAWFADRAFDQLTQTSVDASLDELSLQLWRNDGSSLTTLIAESIAQYTSVQHLSFIIPDSGDYTLRVTWEGEIYDAISDANIQPFGIAWNVTPAPEPASTSLLLIGLLTVTRRRRK